MIAAPGCKKGSGDSAALTPPAAPEYADPFAEFKDLPNQITAQMDWVTQPLRDATALGDEFTALQAMYNLDVKALGGLAKVAFTDGKIEISADVSIAAEAKGDVEALLGKIKAAGEAVFDDPQAGQQGLGRDRQADPQGAGAGRQGHLLPQEGDRQRDRRGQGFARGQPHLDPRAHRQHQGVDPGVGQQGQGDPGRGQDHDHRADRRVRG